MGCTAGNLDGGAASAMVEIWQVNLWFAAGCCETVPFGTILPPILISTPSSVDALWCRFSDAVSLQSNGLQCLTAQTRERAFERTACAWTRNQ